MSKPEQKPIKLDTILLRKIRACICGDIRSINEVDTGVFYVTVTRRNIPSKYFKYTVEVKSRGERIKPEA